MNTAYTDFLKYGRIVLQSRRRLSQMAEAGSSKKRSVNEVESHVEVAHKAQKIHPFFTKRHHGKQAAEGPFQWLEPLGPNRSCLHGINLQPKASSKVAALDLDGTIIKSDLKGKSVDGVPVWEWWRSFVPDKLKFLYNEGYAIIILSNQGTKPAALKTWKEKIPLIGAALPDVPFRIMAATQRDQYRKPMPGMWNELEKIFKEEGIGIDKEVSFFVGDAAGRQYPGGRADFSSTDRKWAENIGLRFFTPEEYFLKLVPHKNYALPGFRASALPQLPRITPTSTPILPHPPRQEVVLFTGYPCLGKSTFYRTYFQSAGYVHINQDTLKTRDKCVKATEEALRDGKSCVIDNTNRNIVTRKYYVDICKRVKIPIRCFLFTDTMDVAWHNNLYRAYNLPPSVAGKEPKRDIIPYSAFVLFQNDYEEPNLSEGFTEIKKVNWIFEGTEEEKRHWSMWLQIDGK